MAGTWGADFLARRQLYLSKIIPKITYAAAVWFLADPTDTEDNPRYRWGLTKDRMKMLGSLQIEVLLELTKSRKNTAVQTMEKEFHVQPILLKLYNIAMNHRCRHYALGSYQNIQESLKIDSRNERACSDQNALDNHPYARLWKLVAQQIDDIRSDAQRDLSVGEFEKRWANPWRRGQWIKEYNNLSVFRTAKEWWVQHLRERAHEHKHFHAAHTPDFADHSLKYFNNLDAAQSTMGLSLRNGNIELKSNPYWLIVSGDTDRVCPLCHNYIHTAEHLVCHCKALVEERKLLRAAAGHLRWDDLLKGDLELTASWAILYFGIERYDKVRNRKAYQFPRDRTPISKK